ncbi:site-specific DNA-methyltransferase [Lysinibacillus sphaericus]|uniref:site-specific DNA-methyltransferase n=1 Tax=Lysinibacillus sphaericus TaxID=1421 RepID=UPI003D7F9867
MLQDNINSNEKVKPNTAFLRELKSKLPEFFTADKYNDDGDIIEDGSFDLEKFQRYLKENNIEELTSGHQLDFIGKDYAKKQAGEFAKTVVVPNLKHNHLNENKQSKNLFFTGDNLEVLRHLQNNYSNSVDMIYIDPPYNTGSDGFVYPDSFDHSDEDLKNMFGMLDEELKRLKSIQGKATHSAWLTFMYPRLWLSKRLLTEKGVIFISIDDNEVMNLKLVCDEIYGESNFITIIPWQSRQSVQNDTDFSINHEYLICYAKNRRSEHRRLKESNQKMWYELESFAFKPLPLDKSNFSNPDNDPRGPWKADPFDAPNIRPNLTYEIVNPKTGIAYLPPSGRCWRTEEASYQKLLADNRIIFGKSGESKPQLKVFYEEKKGFGSVENSWFTGEKFGTTTQGTKELQNLFGGKAYFDTPKPTKLIKKLIELSTSNDAIIMDFFAGSGTTADSVMQLNAEDDGNRKFIIVQIAEKTYELNEDGTKKPIRSNQLTFNDGYMSIDEITKERIKLASKKIQETAGLTLSKHFDGGFKHYYVVSPEQPTLDDLEAFDFESGLFKNSIGQLVQLPESGFDNMIQPFSSEGLQVSGNATGKDTIVTTWIASDGYQFDVEINNIEFDGYNAYYIDNSRLYLIDLNWGPKQTQQLLNAIGTNKLSVQTIVLYGYSFDLESIKEIEIGLKQLDNKVNILKRY